MQMIGLARLGRDAELRKTQSGESVCSLSLAFNYGRKAEDGSRPTQWVEGTLWGRQAEALVDYLLKGKLVCVTIDDPYLQTYEGRNGPGTKLAGRISSLEFAGGASDGQQQQRQAPAQPAAQQQPAPAASRPAPADDMDDDIPF